MKSATFWRSLALPFLLALAGCDLLWSDRDDVWAGTRVYVPWTATGDGQAIDASVRDLIARGGTEGDPLAGLLRPDTRLPVIVFLHGCSGDMAGVPELFVKKGFAVVAPWSFARPDRPASCGDVGPETLRWRLDEARWTLERLRGLPWVDSHGLALMGASEGGLAAAQYADLPAAVAAVVIMGWTCTDRENADFDGLRVPADRAVYAVVGADDPLVVSARLGGDCGYALRGRAMARNQVIRGLGHAVPDKAVIDDIAAFIEEARRR
ncbi:dienelactone hydrolase family protein [Zavarzinia compransoris]|uniref:Dienelactone hydrolase domain-containing protein n=1 Tax=Zavarzinia compransoris TaxID=1264899 RepID=A0A317DTF2_9PROT|nr:hypothetical protein [Zavarzinia compransoris]PWR17968.1 hypothetical protein DKG75_20725 [Zavarzinia compransoris]TDP40375.1 dienelactone hydrolase [Zavarzinia compransoris]